MVLCPFPTILRLDDDRSFRRRKKSLDSAVRRNQPTQGADVNGPTAIIKSVAKLSNDNMNIGMVHNFKLMAGLLDTPEGENGIITLLRTACAFGNGEMQFNYMDNNTLLEAQKHPGTVQRSGSSCSRIQRILYRAVQGCTG